MEGPFSVNRVVVIGAGMGGMCTAARLAKMGHSVTVLEASERFGGKCRSETIDGFTFDTGPTLLTIPAVYRDFFQRTGKHLGQVLTLEPVDPSFHYRFADGSEVLFSNLSRKKTLDAIEKSFGKDSAGQWDEALKTAEAMWDVSREPFIEHELKLRSFFKPTSLRDLFIIKPWRSLRRSLLKDKRLQMIMDRYATYSGSDPRKAPLVLSTIAFIEEAFGAWHVRGGMGKLAEAVYTRCIDLGVAFEFNAEAAEVLIQNGNATGVRLRDGRIFEAENVVANCDATTLYNRLVPKRYGASERKKIANSEPSFGGFSIFLGLSNKDNVSAHHTVIFPRDYDAEFNSLFDSKTPVEEPTIYICSPTDDTMAPPGCQAMSILVNAPRHGDFDWSNEEFAAHYCEKIIDLIEISGIPIRNRVVVKEFRTPLDLQRDTFSPGGSIYGSSSNGARAAFLRAKNRSPIPHLFCVGGSAHPGGGLPLVALSAEMVAEAIGTRNGRPQGH